MFSKSKFKIIYELLKSKYGNLDSSLNFSNEVECWAAVLLSVQNTDKHINTITPKLFVRFKTFEDYTNSNIDEIFEYIKGVNYNRTKAKYLYNGAKIICSEFQDTLPSNLNDLMKLPGVGRKVGNVILSEMNNTAEGIAIDTHNLRVWNRLINKNYFEKQNLSKNNVTASLEKLSEGLKELNPLSKALSANDLEQLLMKNLDKSIWREISLLVIEHGRNTCKPRNPKCEECILRKYCEYYNSQKP